MANRTKLTPQKLGRFLSLLRASGNVTHAAQAIGVRRQYMYEVRAADAQLAADWDDAVESYADALEAVADARAVEGVVHRLHLSKDGEVLGEERRYSDALLMFRLKGLRPDTYRERRQVEQTGPAGGPLQVTFVNYADTPAASLSGESAKQPGAAGHTPEAGARQ